MYQLYIIPPLETKKITLKGDNNMYYDVVVNSDLSKCEQLYRFLLVINCQQLTHGVVYLRQAVLERERRCIKYAYRVCREDTGTWFYHSYKNREEVRNEISLTDFIRMVKPERTVTL